MKSSANILNADLLDDKSQPIRHFYIFLFIEHWVLFLFWYPFMEKREFEKLQLEDFGNFDIGFGKLQY